MKNRLLLLRSSVACRPNCLYGSFYIGQTKRNIKLRMEEHNLEAIFGSHTSPQKTPSKNYISPKNTWPKLHYPEYTLPERAFSRNYIFLNMHFPEFTLA